MSICSNKLWGTFELESTTGKNSTGEAFGHLSFSHTIFEKLSYVIFTNSRVNNNSQYLTYSLDALLATSFTYIVPELEN